MSEHKSAVRLAIEAAIASIGKISNKDAIVIDAEGNESPLHPKKTSAEKASMRKYGYTLEHKKAMEDAGVL
jgi:hypothetical protein